MWLNYIVVLKDEDFVQKFATVVDGPTKDCKQVFYLLLFLL
jgi:hypothetical protein